MIKQTISKEGLEQYAERATKIYGFEVLENRAVPDYRDGLKPVHRAILWSMYCLKLHHTGPYKKAARTIGETIGTLHPRGDSACYKAMAGMVNTSLALIDGYGNWGSHIEQPAAMRYTEARLSKFSDLYLLDPEYIAVVEMQKNYSEDRMFPVVFPAKVPTVLLNENTSIAVGISASSPPFALKGVLELSKLALSGTKLTPELCYKHLRFNYKYGGKCLSSKEELLEFFKTGNTSLLFEPEYIEDLKHRRFTITSTCPGLSSENTIKTLFKKIAEIQGVRMIHDAEDKDGIKYVIEFGKVGDEKVLAGFASIKKLLPRKEKFDFGVVERLTDGTNFFRTNPIDIINRWCVWRTEIERRVIANRITKSEEEIKRLNLLILALDSLSVIIEALRKDDSEKYLVAKLKITQQEAEYIMDMKLRQLKKMQRSILVTKKKEEETALKQHKLHLKNPQELIVKSLASVTQ